jgi:hypothetical protein
LQRDHIEAIRQGKSIRGNGRRLDASGPGHPKPNAVPPSEALHNLLELAASSLQHCKIMHIKLFAKLCPLSLLLGIMAACSTPLRAAEGVQISQLDDKLRIEINGELFTEYHYLNVPRPYFYPVLGPDELAMTRSWPMESPAGEEHDHPHHRGLWYAHGSVDGLDFWSEEKNFCKIVHDGFVKIQSGKKRAVIISKDKWVDPNGTPVCTDVRTLRIYNRPGSERLFDFDITLQAPPDKPVVFGDTKEGTMATRVAETMRLQDKNKQLGDGHIVLSTGLRDEQTWGKKADWCDYYGPVHGKTVGLAIFDHPDNLRHPTTWHVRDYGLFAANPYGIHDFEKKPKGTGDFTLPPGQSITFRYRFYYHRGNEIEARVAEHYAEYVRAKPGKE